MLLSRTESTIEAIYTQSPPAFGVHALGAAFVEDTGRSLAGNARFVGHVANRYLRIDSFVHFEGSAARRRAVNELLSLALPPALSISPETARSIKDFVALVRDDLSQRPFPPGYVVSTRWRLILEGAVRSAAQLDDARHVAVQAMARVVFDMGMPILSAAQARELRESRSRYDAQHPELRAIGESALALPGTVADVGPGFSYNIEQSFGYYHDIVSGIGLENISGVAIEVGSGFGRTPRILHLLRRFRCIVLVDLPGSLTFAFAYLRVNFPDARFHMILSPADVSEGLTERYDFIFCPVNYLESLRLGEVQLVINTYSLGEMQQCCIDHILRCISVNIKPRFFYSLNIIFEDKNLHYDASGGTGEGSEIVLDLAPEWWPRRFEMLPLLLDDGYRSHASVVLERLEDTEPAALVSRLRTAAALAQKGSPEWLGPMYLAALWTPDVGIIDEFLDGLHSYIASQRFDQFASYDFEKIGEVRFLQRRRAALVSNSVPT